MKYSVASWNIAGAYTIDSSDLFDYSTYNINYFVQNLKTIEPDVIFLQETHMPNDGRISLAGQIAKELGFELCFDTIRARKSHIDSNQQFGLSIISRYKLADSHALLQPYVDLPLYNSDGSILKMFPAYLQRARHHRVNLYNTHLQPIHLAREKWGSSVGKKYANEIDNFMTDNLSSPFIFAGDFNAPNLFQDFPGFIDEFALRDALPQNEPTGIEGKMDYIL